MLKQPNSLMHHLDPQVLSVNAWLLSTDKCQHKAFLRGLEACYQPHGQFICWYRQRQNDLYSASSAECADFLTFLFHKKSRYRSIFSSVLQPIEDIPLGQHPYIIRLLKGIFNFRPPIGIKVGS